MTEGGPQAHRLTRAGVTASAQSHCGFPAIRCLYKVPNILARGIERNGWFYRLSASLIGPKALLWYWCRACLLIWDRPNHSCFPKKPKNNQAPFRVSSGQASRKWETHRSIGRAQASSFCCIYCTTLQVITPRSAGDAWQLHS